MTGNKNTEETVNLILDVAFGLFMERGYERTSIQDITDNLEGISKGTIYHYFESKEDILVAVTDRITVEQNQMFAEIRNCTDLTGREKLKAIFKESLFRPVQEDIYTVAPDLGNSPKLMFRIFRETIDEAAPNYILPIIEQGISDGSVQTDYPAELAELIILSMKIWLNPMIFNHSAEEIYRKFMMFRQMMQGFGLDILDDEMLGRLQQLAILYQKNK